MARRQEFDDGEVLTAAMHAFRKFGYAGVSIKTLEAETGLSSGSIYNRFGGKDDVYRRVLSHYNETVVAKRIRHHLGHEDPVKGLLSLYDSLLEEPGNGAFGCLLTNSAVEFSGQDSLAGASVKTGFDMLRNAFREALMRLPGMDAQAAEPKAMRLLVYYEGLLVLIRHGQDKSVLKFTLESEINSIIGDADA